MSINHYRESGSFNPASAGIAFLILLTAALIMGYAYAAISLFNPIIYLNLLLLLGTGIAIYWITTVTFDLLKIHNRNLRIMFVMASSSLTWYFQWCATMDYLVVESIVSPVAYLMSLDWILYVESFMENLGIAYDYGYYELFGIVIKGPLLVAIWLLELTIFIVYPLITIISHKPRPYSSRLDRWYPQFILEKQFRVVTGSNLFEKELAQNPIKKIANLSAGRGNSYSTIHVFYEPEESSQYISIVNRTYNRDKDKTNTDQIITNLEISSSDAKEILSTYSHVKK